MGNKWGKNRVFNKCARCAGLLCGTLAIASNHIASDLPRKSDRSSLPGLVDICPLITMVS